MIAGSIAYVIVSLCLCALYLWWRSTDDVPCVNHDGYPRPTRPSVTYTYHAAGRGGGKTTWLLQQIEEARAAGLDVAVVTHDGRSRDRLAHRELLGATIDVYSEQTFRYARGHRYDHIFVDNADLFHDSPEYLCRSVDPGASVTFTYTPDPFE